MRYLEKETEIEGKIYKQHIKKVEDVKIAYIGGGSRGWAWGLMSDLASCEDMSGKVDLYDIDFEAAYHNEIIGNKYNTLEDTKSRWDYRAVKTIDEALTGADFVVISILPGTFDEMESDVHCAEKYGIYQPVGDTVGPGGIVRALRTVPMFEVIAKAIEKNCPEAWVINYTNPMTLCVKTLYNTFPKIKAFGCCHEVFGTQMFLAKIVTETTGLHIRDHKDIKTNVLGINHFTWVTKAQYKNMDLYEMYREYVKENKNAGMREKADNNWMNKGFTTMECVKMDLFSRYGYIAAAGDRHLAEFCEANWYLGSPDRVHRWKYVLTTVDERREGLREREERSAKLISGEEELKIKNTGEEGVEQMRALLGLRELVTNVNVPNMGQIPNLPMGAVVETNAVFRDNSVEPVFAGNIPEEIYPMIARICGEQQIVARACKERDLELAFQAFCNDPLVTIDHEQARELFAEMLDNTSKYLNMYDIEGWKNR